MGREALRLRPNYLALISILNGAQDVEPGAEEGVLLHDLQDAQNITPGSFQGTGNHGF